MSRLLTLMIGGVLAANAYAQGAAPDAPPPNTKAAEKMAPDSPKYDRKTGTEKKSHAVKPAVKEAQPGDNDKGLQPAPGR